MTAATIDPVDGKLPLVVDLDGTLIRSDLLIEALFQRLVSSPSSVILNFFALRHGKAHFKDAVARGVSFDPATLPYDEVVLRQVREAVTEGRPVYIASASNARFVSVIAEHFGFFSGWFGSDSVTNLSGENKARLLVETFGEGGFDYIGNDRADLHVWSKASKRFCVRTPARVKKHVRAAGVDVLPSPRPSLSSWLKLIRVHQYAKNALIFLPLFTAHKFDLPSLLDCMLAIAAFSLCASSAYIFNDIIDLAADREHPTKRARPLASGKIALQDGVCAIPILFLCAFALALWVSPAFLAILLGYFALTISYSIWLKKKMLVDIVALAMLYTLRVIAGAVAIGVFVSEWLLAFSMFLFTALALIKRYIELATRLDRELPDPANRNYKQADMQIVAALAGAAGFNAVTVFALYISSDTVHSLYRHPKFLWLVCPILMYWLSRMLMMAHRRQVHDDPIVFALKDRISILASVCIAAIMLLAI
ncbi:MAG: UbiA family prenyltransferase [Acidobacteriaceae bacterium]|nr:UbiA family prenyltransferase [Acidobacteriaceae bacterium]MBV9754838.1 UbiA family prenyltransferase [Hyphomicrobiales bacterium]